MFRKPTIPTINTRQTGEKMKNIREYEEDFERLHTYFKNEKIDTEKLKTYRKFNEAMSSLKKRWDMTESGKKIFFKYQQVYLKQSGIIETKVPKEEVRVSISGNLLFKLPRITAAGCVQNYWTSERRAIKFGYRIKKPRMTKAFKSQLPKQK